MATGHLTQPVAIGWNPWFREWLVSFDSKTAW